MDVDFNNLRIQAMISYDKLCRRLNSAIDKDGDINIPAEEIQDYMDSLRQHICIIACVYNENEKYFDMVRDKVTVADFNPDNII
jgi:hypothetical protein